MKYFLLAALLGIVVSLLRAFGGRSLARMIDRRIAGIALVIGGALLLALGGLVSPDAALGRNAIQLMGAIALAVGAFRLLRRDSPSPETRPERR